MESGMDSLLFDGAHAPTAASRRARRGNKSAVSTWPAPQFRHDFLSLYFILFAPQNILHGGRSAIRAQIVERGHACAWAVSRVGGHRVLAFWDDFKAFRASYAVLRYGTRTVRVAHIKS